MTRLIRIVVTVLGVAAVAWLVTMPMRRGELADKPIYADLQGIEMARRSVALSEPVFIPGKSAAGGVFGIPADEPDFPNAWIAASVAKADGSIYAVMPQPEHLHVTCNQVETVVLKAKAGESVAPSVRSFLEGHCTR